MAFTCVNEIEISGGSAEERGAAAALVLAVDCADEDSASREEVAAGARGAGPRGAGRGGDALVLRFESADGIPEDELLAIAPQFPGLAFSLVYFSLDGEFYGCARAGAAAESADFDEGTRELVGRRYEGDGIAFAKAALGLEPS